ncbi:hypothetical protein GQ43DRAFT_478932 [Delitschia confertaspora ATCC 74209]|uniref:Uncharacterized protein n=1 Tax=Delitschia confertaspora ATCC 74209 TaxID=1513339 RepID=A0A9P4JQL8_9PLEO|nr:hypothetical protein GQ43DRAFT_478932 [Delitschia confertaspora ATCC 74209]
MLSNNRAAQFLEEEYAVSEASTIIKPDPHHNHPDDSDPDSDHSSILDNYDLRPAAIRARLTYIRTLHSTTKYSRVENKLHKRQWLRYKPAKYVDAIEQNLGCRLEDLFKGDEWNEELRPRPVQEKEGKEDWPPYKGEGVDMRKPDWRNMFPPHMGFVYNPLRYPDWEVKKRLKTVNAYVAAHPGLEGLPFVAERERSAKWEKLSWEGKTALQKLVVWEGNLRMVKVDPGWDFKPALDWGERLLRLLEVLSRMLWGRKQEVRELIEKAVGRRRVNREVTEGDVVKVINGLLKRWRKGEKGDLSLSAEVGVKLEEEEKVGMRGDREEEKKMDWKGDGDEKRKRGFEEEEEEYEKPWEERELQEDDNDDNDSDWQGWIGYDPGRL